MNKLVYFKKDKDINNIETLRPIQINSNIVKILEKIIIRSIDTNAILHYRQRGFKPGTSTQDNIQEVVILAK